jgi:hypothetical protein
VIPKQRELLDNLLAVLQLDNVELKTYSSLAISKILISLHATKDDVNDVVLHYLPVFLPYLIEMLKALKQKKLVSVALGIITDFANELASEFRLYLDAVIQVLLDGLKVLFHFTIIVISNPFSVECLYFAKTKC